MEKPSMQLEIDPKMENYKHNYILEKLFTSRARVAVLTILFHHKQPLYEAEIVYKTNQKRATVQTEIRNLRNIGVLQIQRTATRTFYSLNKKFRYYNELRKMFPGRS